MQQQQLLLLQQQQAAAAAGGQTQAQREQAVRDAYASQAQANAIKMQQMGQGAGLPVQPGFPAQPGFPVPSGQVMDISGSWLSEWGNTDIQLSPLGDGSYSVTGGWDQGWNKRAIFQNGRYVPSTRTVTVNYVMPWKPGMIGTAIFVVSGNGQQMVGNWRQPDGNGKWTLSRAPGYDVGYMNRRGGGWDRNGRDWDRNGRRWDQRRGLADISGDWNSNLGPVSLDVDKSWNGLYSVKGSWTQGFGGKSIRIRDGVYRANPTPTLTFQYQSRMTGAIGNATFTLNNSGTQLSGSYNEGGRTGNWVMTRNGGFVPNYL
jgi:hypothetical protein